MESKYKSALINIVDRIGIRWPGESGRRFGITSILFHSFFGPDETLTAGRERLRRFCEWIHNNYTPLTAAEYIEAALSNAVVDNGIFVTFDDAKKRLLDCIDIFLEFDIPITIFAVCGWLDSDQIDNETIALARIVAALEHYHGPAQSLQTHGNDMLLLGSKCSEIEIEKILDRFDANSAFSVDLWKEIQQVPFITSLGASICSWGDLKSIASDKIAIGSHSISHCRMAGKSTRRIQYEINASKKLIDENVGCCDLFAYPYGTWDVVNADTTKLLTCSDYKCGFLVSAGYGSDNNRYTLPRADIPDSIIDDSTFQSLVRGGQIPLIMAKNFLTSRNA